MRQPNMPRPLHAGTHVAFNYGRAREGDTAREGTIERIHRSRRGQVIFTVHDTTVGGYRNFRADYITDMIIC